MKLRERLTKLVARHPGVQLNLPRRRLIELSVERKEALVSATGTLATWTPPESTGRRPQDTYLVRRPESEATIDWESPACNPMTPDTFDMIMEDALDILTGSDSVFITDRVLGADSSYAMPCRTITCKALTALFTDTMFRPVPPDIGRSKLADRGFTIVAVPQHKLNPAKYEGRLRKLPNGKTADVAVAMDMDRGLGGVIGSDYAGSVKKMMFTVMNYVLPGIGVLPLHCSANESANGNTALLLGLSGTGKTTLSADAERALLGDDEHGWSEDGVANLEYGCYAKLIHLRKDKEPEIWRAMFHEAPYLEHGAICENTMMYPNGEFDVDDERLTENSRGSFPLTFLTNVKQSAMGGHPQTILFLTADANGVLPPIARLSKEQAMLWFMMGYTSRLAGTEAGVTDPVSTFARFFGEPFMPRHPHVYAAMLGQKLQRNGTRVFLVNTGWSGGPFGVGSRMDIALTRQLVGAAVNGKARDVEYREDPLFHIQIPLSWPGVDAQILDPRNTWANKAAFDERARKVAMDFSQHFDKVFGNKNIDPEIVAQCPSK